MRTSSLVSLLLFSILISEVQGIRLNKTFLSAGHKKINHEGTVIEERNGAVGEAIQSKDGHYSGKSRKLVTEITPNPTSTSTTTKNGKNIGGTMSGSTSKGKSNADGASGKEESFSVNSSPVSKHRKEVAPETYPDILDLSAMDYTPAKRKPPIHN